MYDFLIVGAGMFGSTFARLATDAGKRCLVIDKRSHIAGNCYTEELEGIHVHKYGPHIFHCNDDGVWNFVNRFSRFNNFRNAPLTFHQGKLYSLPFNMYTFNQLWGVTTPREAQKIIESQRLKLDRKPHNLEEQALVLVGRDIYEKLIKNYTKKQWMKDPNELPPEIIKRLPIRFTWDNNYFNDRYQGIPEDGYTSMFKRMLTGIEVRLSSDYFSNRGAWRALAKQLVFTGCIDQYFDYAYGELEYRTLRFESEWHEEENHQGNAVINYADINVPWTRVIEHKHFAPNSASKRTYVTREIPDTWSRNKEPYYPIGDEHNLAIHRRYEDLALAEPGVIFGGRLAEYRYYDMHQVIASAIKKARDVLDKNS